jgi:hypothetical protein
VINIFDDDGDFGVECENCECLVCIKNDDAKCQNCSSCNGDKGYNKWKMNCKRFVECENPEETIQTVLGDIITANP